MVHEALWVRVVHAPRLVGFPRLVYVPMMMRCLLLGGGAGFPPPFNGILI